MVKPWVKIDGGLNRRVLDRLLGAVLSHILSKPGSNLSQLNERFHPALQPFQTRELVEVEVFELYSRCADFIETIFKLQILERIGCIELYSIKKTGKAGPFAPRTTLELGRFKATCQHICLFKHFLLILFFCFFVSLKYLLKSLRPIRLFIAIRKRMLLYDWASLLVTKSTRRTTYRSAVVITT